MTRSRLSLIERGKASGVDLVGWARLLAVVGLELTVDAYPTRQAIRDVGHAALLARLKVRLHESLKWRTEVPMPIAGDLRGWDALIRGPDWRVGVEAETRPADLQALTRRVALKRRDSGVDAVLLVLRDGRRNRTLARAYADVLAEHFPTPGPQALAMLGAGTFPGSACILL